MKFIFSAFLLLIISCGGIDAGNTIDTEQTDDAEYIEDTENTENEDTEDIYYLCPENDKFCHEHDGLYWSDVSEKDLELYYAETYCENLGGRLPTINELRTLVRNCPAVETGGSCGLTDECLLNSCLNAECWGCDFDLTGKYSVFGDCSRLWSYSYYGSTDNIWHLYFDSASISNFTFDYTYYARCVK